MQPISLSQHHHHPSQNHSSSADANNVQLILQSQSPAGILVQPHPLNRRGQCKCLVDDTDTRVFVITNSIIVLIKQTISTEIPSIFNGAIAITFPVGIPEPLQIPHSSIDQYSRLHHRKHHLGLDPLNTAPRKYPQHPIGCHRNHNRLQNSLTTTNSTFIHLTGAIINVITQQITVDIFNSTTTSWQHTCSRTTRAIARVRSIYNINMTPAQEESLRFSQV